MIDLRDDQLRGLVGLNVVEEEPHAPHPSTLATVLQ